MAEVTYATRGQVKQSLEVAASSYADHLIDSKLKAATESVEGLLHRRFYPETKTVKFDWPNGSSAPPWELDLGINEIISVSQLTSGGVVIPPGDVIPRRHDNHNEPPFTFLELNQASSSAFRGGDTWQQSIELTGLFGFRDTNTTMVDGSLTSNLNNTDSSSMATIVPVNAILEIDAGALVVVGTERMIVRECFMADTGGNTTNDVIDSQNAKVIPVTDGTAFALREVILVNGERMRIQDIAGNNLVVVRAYDGTSLTTIPNGTDVFAYRSFLLQRAVLGSTISTHVAPLPVTAHRFPTLVTELCIAEAVVLLEQNAAGYARTVGSGTAQREVAGLGLEDLRTRTIQAYGRSQRSQAV